MQKNEKTPQKENNKEDIFTIFVKPMIIVAAIVVVLFTLSNKMATTIDKMVEDKTSQIISQYEQNGTNNTLLDDKKEELGGEAIGDVEFNSESVTPDDFSAITESAKKSMVSISNYQKVTIHDVNGEHQTSEQLASAGSGVIIGDNGDELWILTNQHIIDSARRLTITFADNTVVEAYTKGFDAQNDVAVLSVKLSSLTEETKNSIAVIKIGDSSKMLSGQTVIAIGDVMNKGQSVTKGIVSIASTPLTLSTGEPINMMQIDAAINYGNSGGALLNTKGELIGIPTAKSIEENIENVGYAIPISEVRGMVETFCAREARKLASEYEEAYLGIEVVEVPKGVLVQTITEHSPAYKSKLCVGDYIVQMDDQKITTISELLSELWYHKAGEIITVKVLRPEGKDYVAYTLTITLEKAQNN